MPATGYEKQKATMKKLLPFLSAALVLAACNSTPKESAVAGVVQPQINPDTVGLAQYQDWKAQHELSPVAEEKPEVVRYVAAPAKQQTRRTYNAPARAAVVQKSAPVVQEENSRSSETRDSGGSGPAASSGDGKEATAGTGTQEEVKEEKKGMSNATKGAVIGGAAGTAAGAIIFKKNRVVGGVVGAVVGAAVGYGVGKAKDKKEAQK
jgi:hypothetical protein